MSSNPFADEPITPDLDIKLPDGTVITRQQMEYELKRELYRRRATQDYLSYVQYTIPEYIAGKVQRYIANQVNEFLNKKTKNALDILLISMPPQHSKSFTVTETVASYYLGRHPRRRAAIVSYGDDLAQLFGRRNKQKIEEYHPELFGHRLASSPNNNTEFELDNNKGGCISRGVFGGITGRGVHLMVIDDPYKNREDADSETYREKVWAEWLNTFKPRIAPGGKLIVIQTRWHEDDLFGRLAATEDHATVINLPVECDDPESDPLGRNFGDSLSPEIGKDRVWLEDFKKSYTSKAGARAWQSLYMGRPTALGGNIIKTNWWQYYDSLPDNIRYTCMSIDATFKAAEENDFVSIQIWKKKNNNFYLVDLINKRLTFTDTIKAIKMFKEKYPETKYILIEEKANGSAIIDVLSREFIGIIPINPEGGKVTRVNAVSHAIESKHVFLPEYAGFTGEFVEQCAAFPSGKHDDMVDAMSQALNRMIYVDGEDEEPEEEKRYRVYTPDMLQDYMLASSQLREHLHKIWGYPIEDDYEY